MHLETKAPFELNSEEVNFIVDQLGLIPAGSPVGGSGSCAMLHEKIAAMALNLDHVISEGNSGAIVECVVTKSSPGEGRHANVNINEVDHWAGDHGQDRYDFWKELATMWNNGKPVPDDEIVYLPNDHLPEGEKSVFWFRTPRLSNLLRPNVGDRAGLDKKDVELYWAAGCKFEIRIPHNAIELFNWLDENKESFCEQLNANLKYDKGSDQELELIFDRKSGNQKNQIKLTSKYLDALWQKSESGRDTEFAPREHLKEFHKTLTEVGAAFEAATLKELKRFKEEGMA